MSGAEMSDADSGRAVELRVGARLENLEILRTLVGALAAIADLDVDSIADLRLAVDELCTRLIGAAGPNATLTVRVDPRDDEFQVAASTICVRDDVVPTGSFSWHVLTSLVPDVQTFQGAPDNGHELDGPGDLFGVTLTMPRAGSHR